MTENNRFSGKQLRLIREAAKMSRFDLSKAINFLASPQTIARYESGTTKPSFDLVQIMANTLQVPTEDLTDATS